MPTDLQLLSREIFDPASLLGAAFYAVIFALLAWILGRAVRIAVRRALAGHVPFADPTAINFLGQLARLAIYIVAFLSYAYHIPVLRQLGSVWLTGVGVISVVMGIAAQSTLGNLISGVSLLLYRPFKLGDRIQVSTPAGLESGIVESFTLGYTILQTDDNRRIVIPNSIMASQTSINISQRTERGTTTLTLTCPRSADIDKARTFLTDLAKSNPKITEVTSCRLTALSDTSSTLTLTFSSSDPASIPDLKSDLLQAAKNHFDAGAIPITQAAGQ